MTTPSRPRRAAIGCGAYEEQSGSGKRWRPTGRYWVRPMGLTWKLLKAEGKREARLEAAERSVEYRPGGDVKFKDVAELYIDRQCPDSSGEPRHKDYCEAEIPRVRTLIEYFGKKKCEDIIIADLPYYKRWRVAQIKRVPKYVPEKNRGGRAVDKDTQTLSNILNFGISVRIRRNGRETSLVTANNVRAGRPRYQGQKEEIRPSRAVMPESADTVHQLVRHAFNQVETEVFGWWELFAMFSGNRISELLRLRLDAKKIAARTTEAEYDPGYILLFEEPKTDLRLSPNPIHGYLMLGRRSKRGLNPWTLIGPEFAQMLECYNHWHEQRYPESPYFFPNLKGEKSVTRWQVSLHITAATKKLKQHHVTAHGYRAFYATKRLREGMSPAFVAAEIGDKTVALVTNTYADGPAGELLSFTPRAGEPSWLKWRRKSAGKALPKTNFLQN